MQIELIKVAEKEFAAGERAIMVDGVRWGRTIVTHRGMHGTKYKFKQEHGNVLLEDPKARYPKEFAVYSEKKRWANEKTWRPTEERVLEKVKELVETGRLRHPAIVKQETAKAMEDYRARCKQADIKKLDEFRQQARAMLYIDDPASDMVERVVKLMQWAQSQ